MAKAKKFVPSDEVLAILDNVKPAIPVLSSKEKTYFKGLTRRGYTPEQITEIIKKAGYIVPVDFFKVITKEEKAKKALERKIEAAKKKAEKAIKKVAVEKTVSELEAELAALNKPISFKNPQSQNS